MAFLGLSWNRTITGSLVGRQSLAAADRVPMDIQQMHTTLPVDYGIPPLMHDQDNSGVGNQYEAEPVSYTSRPEQTHHGRPVTDRAMRQLQISHYQHKYRHHGWHLPQYAHHAGTIQCPLS